MAAPQRFLAPAALAALALLLTGCANQRVDPAPALAAGAASVEAAWAAGAPELAPGPLAVARAKLQRAQLRAHGGDKAQALRLAEQAELDAQLARASAEAQRTRDAAAQAEDELRALRARIDGTPPSPAPLR
jgi:hypothetical protein